jgi:hypothetical protein
MNRMIQKANRTKLNAQGMQITANTYYVFNA